MNKPMHEDDFYSDEEVLEAEIVEPGLSRVYRKPPPPSSKETVYHVPTRFGLAAILCITTAMAILYGVLRTTNSPAVFYWFFSLLTLLICVVQMRFGQMPRQASIVAGAVLMPLFVLVGVMFSKRPFRDDDFIAAVIASVFGGAFMGYLTGTCLGGVFLLIDLLDKFWTRHSQGITGPGK